MTNADPDRQGGPLAPLRSCILSCLVFVTAVFLAAGCSSGETSSPGFPRTELAPIEVAPFPYSTPEDVGLSA